MFFQRRFLAFYCVPLLFAGCAPKAGTPLPDGAFLQAAQNRMAQTESVAPISDKPQPAYIDIPTLAKRLPTWKLAANIEKSGQNARFSAIEAPQEPRALAMKSAPLEKPDGRLPRPVGETDEPIGSAPGYERAPLRVAARDATALEDQGQQRQEGTLESFLSDVARKENAHRQDDQMRLRAELEDEIEASQRLALASLEPLLPPPATQLEMTNLRIQLLPNSPESDAEKEQAAARLTQLEAQWRAQLRAQADKRFEELRRLLTEVPIEKREAGFKEIEKTLNARDIQEKNLRKLVETALRERIAAGFGPDDTAPLFIQLPGAQLPSQSLGSTPVLGASAPRSLPTNQINSNIALIWPSAAAFTQRPDVSNVLPRTAAPSTAAQKRAAALRKQALQEATRWAKSIAKRRHWKLQNGRTGANGQSVPDRTGEALQLLNL